MKAVVLTVAAGAIGAVLVTVGALIVTPLAVSLEQQYNPPLADWTVQSYTVEGRDVVVSGTVVKPRSCSYRPPPRARDEHGLNYLVESQTPTRNVTWAASDIPQRFGPWRVSGAAGKTLTFYQEHQCHPLWRLVVELGTVKPDGTLVPKE